ncbi:MAG: phenylalanine--tRNA ligase subunit alpha [Planctomycetaceae bacterium]|nr:phenylalanine--tRNA ligase subunit alpha [Planctomycetaceae bacterium]
MQTIKEQFAADLAAAATAEAVEQVRIKYLGKKGSITTLAKNTDFRSLSAEEKRSFGSRLNELKNYAEEALAAAKETAANAAPAKKSTGLDLTLPGTGRTLGSLHPISLIQMELESIFQGMGFTVVPSPECELEFYNFDAVNIPSDHPAREMQDTYWLKNQMLMRTHTSANQVRTMQRLGVPLRAIFPGRCFRNEAVDPSHENTFYQCEGLVVDKNISVANLIAVMKTLLSEIFHRDVTVRLRPGFFPFVEPGFELDIRCLLCEGDGCSTCHGTGWIELIPCGLIHPKVLECAGVDPTVYSGFAFGAGLTRLAMMKFGIPDIRLLNAGDVRFNEQFPTYV